MLASIPGFDTEHACIAYLFMLANIPGFGTEHTYM